VPTVNCESGTYFDGVQCKACAVGRYTKFSHPPYPSSCDLCPSGRYNNQNNLTHCEKCATGKLSSPDRTYCADCSAGEYSYNDEECVECEYGKYAPQALSDSCLTCVAGSHTNLPVKATTCTSCDAGKYSHNSSYTCTKCDEGKYSSSGAEVCIKCKTGFMSPSMGASSCIACSAGFYSDFQGAVNCTACAKGKYQGSTGQSKYSQCESGRYTDELQSKICAACSAGTYADQVASTNCSSCSKGKFQGSTGQSACVACEGGKYSSDIGQTSCTSCSNGKTSKSGLDECTYAEPGYYMTDRSRLTSNECPSHARCKGHLYTPIPERHYWVDHSELKYAGDLYKCSRVTCIGGQNISSCWTLAGYNASECLKDSKLQLQCEKGSRGPLCGSCEVGYVYAPLAANCQACGGNTTLFTYLVIGFLFTFGIVIGVFVNLDDEHRLKQQFNAFVRYIDRGSLKVS
jgi:hypothetical protein